MYKENWRGGSVVPADNNLMTQARCRAVRSQSAVWNNKTVITTARVPNKRYKSTRKQEKLPAAFLYIRKILRQYGYNNCNSLQRQLSQLVTIGVFSYPHIALSYRYSWDCTDFVNRPNLSRSVDLGWLSNQRFLRIPRAAKTVSVTTPALFAGLKRVSLGNGAQKWRLFFCYTKFL